MQTTGTWVRVTGTDQCEPHVPPWRRHGYTTTGWGSLTPSSEDQDDPDGSTLDLILRDLLETWVAEQEAVDAGAARAADRAPVSTPEERVTEGLAAAREGMEHAAEALTEAPRMGSAALGESLEAAGALAEQVEASTFAIAWEACERGLHKDSGFSLRDWMATRMPWADRRYLGRIQAVATACQQLQNRPIGEAVSTGRFPLRRAGIIVDALEKVRRVIDPDQYESYVEILMDAAANQKLDDKQLRRAAERMLELLLDQEEADRRERAAHEQRSVRIFRRANGMTRIVVDAPAGPAAMIKGALTSKLAAPQPGPDGELDPRTTSQRAFDAFTTVFGRGLSCPEGTPQMPRATLFVTMKLDDLRGATRGHGVTLGGDMLSARQVRQAACEAEIIPVVLGGESQILDFGRAKRLATREQVKALYLRDGGCTFPGCTVPAEWTIAHHAPWFSRGGATDLDKLALLCERHHTHVHQYDLECTIDATGVTWHVR